MWEKQGKTGVFVASGGQGSDEVVSEAESMRRYLTESRHVPADAVLMEDRSTTTMENLRFSKEIMDARSGVQSVPGRRGLAYRCALVTSDYPCVPSQRIRASGLKADGVRQPYAWLLLAHGVHPGVHSRYQGAFVAVLCARPAGH